MADNDLKQTLSQVIHMIRETDKLIEQLFEPGSNTLGVQSIALQRELDEVFQTQADMKDELNDLLGPFYDGDNIVGLELSELQDMIFGVIDSEGPGGMVGVLEGLQALRVNIDALSHKVCDLMENLNVQPMRMEVKESYKRTSASLDDHASTQGEQEGSSSTSEGAKRLKDDQISNVRDVAVDMYGFPASIASDIQDSLGHRKLIKNRQQFDDDEAAILFLDDYIFGGQDSDGVNWVRVQGLKHRFKELKKKIFEKEDGKMLSASTAAAGAIAGAIASAIAGKVTPETPRAKFRKAIRNWVFHIEDAFFNFIIYELYHMLACNERAEAIFEKYRGTLKELKESQQGMVPITVYKTLHMLENPKGFKVNGVVKRAPTVSGTGWANLDKMMKLEEMMEQIHETMLRLMGFVFTSGLSFTNKIILEDEASSYEYTLEKLEDEIREIERKIKQAKSKYSLSWHIPAKD